MLKYKVNEPLLPGLNFNQNQLFFINFAQLWCSKYSDEKLEVYINADLHSPDELR